jgi:hypothetical protein
MKFVSIFAFLATFVAATGLDQFSFETELMGIQFDDWAETHGKVYTCEHAKAKRFEIWRRNHGELPVHRHTNNSFVGSYFLALMILRQS